MIFEHYECCLYSTCTWEYLKSLEIIKFENKQCILIATLSPPWNQCSVTKNKNKIELVIYYVLDVVFVAHQDTVLCVGKLTLVVNLACVINLT